MDSIRQPDTLLKNSACLVCAHQPDPLRYHGICLKHADQLGIFSLDAPFKFLQAAEQLGASFLAMLHRRCGASYTCCLTLCLTARGLKRS